MRDAGPARCRRHRAAQRAGGLARATGRWASTKADARTRLVRRAHEGPLVVQKPLYPEGDDVCQCIVVHPPGGIAGGDDIELARRCGIAAPTRNSRRPARREVVSRCGPPTQRSGIVFRVADGGVLEWLPQGTIVFDGAHATTADSRASSTGTASYLGWDVVCLGRTASSERFTQAAVAAAHRHPARRCTDLERANGPARRKFSAGSRRRRA